jgi:hypothetical protein
MVDKRRPAHVTEDLRGRLARELGPLGFAVRSKAFVRRASQRIEMSSSHRNAPGDVTAWIALVVTDPRIARVQAGWRAGGQLGGGEFYDDPPRNVAERSQADELVERIRRRLAFFDLVEDPDALLRSACSRYVPGMVAPRVVVPYLLVRLGASAVETYARALLRGRPELWPAFVGAARRNATSSARHSPDHGTELAWQLAKHGIAPGEPAPPDAVVSVDPAAANLRCFFGRQLRAWGEPEAAALLLRVTDDRIHALRAEQELLPGPVVDSVAYAQVVLREVVGDRPPRRKAPSPRLFQYHVLHAPFFPRSAAPGRTK